MSYSSDLLALSPTVFLKMNDTGASLVDSSGNSHTFSLGSTGIVKNQPSILVNDSSTGSIQTTTITTRIGSLADSTVLGATTVATMAMWIKPTAYTSSPSYFFGKFNSLSFSVSGTTPSAYFGSFVNGPPEVIVPNNTYFMVATYDGANMKLYVNGVLVGTSANTAAIPTNANVFEIDGLVNTAPLIGYMQHFSFWNSVALTATQIQSLYMSGAATAAEATGLAAQVMPWSKQIIAANAARYSITVSNDSDTQMYLGLGTTAVLGTGITLLPGRSWTSTVWKGSISAVCRTYLGGKNIAIQEQ